MERDPSALADIKAAWGLVLRVENATAGGAAIFNVNGKPALMFLVSQEGYPSSAFRISNWRSPSERATKSCGLVGHGERVY
jgi:hypothetical protein